MFKHRSLLVKENVYESMALDAGLPKTPHSQLFSMTSHSVTLQQNQFGQLIQTQNCLQIYSPKVYRYKESTCSTNICKANAAGC